MRDSFVVAGDFTGGTGYLPLAPSVEAGIGLRHIALIADNRAMLAHLVDVTVKRIGQRPFLFLLMFETIFGILIVP